MTASFDASQNHVAMRRMGRSEELSNLLVYLASDESSFSTGAEFIADGGETAGVAPGRRSFAMSGTPGGFCSIYPSVATTPGWSIYVYVSSPAQRPMRSQSLVRVVAKLWQ
jgi:hypothetical protein